MSESVILQFPKLNASKKYVIHNCHFIFEKDLDRSLFEFGEINGEGVCVSIHLDGLLIVPKNERWNIQKYLIKSIFDDVKKKLFKGQG